jgi:hypothetical protein
MAERASAASRMKCFKRAVRSACGRFSLKQPLRESNIREQKCPVQDTNSIKKMSKESISKIKNN